MIVGIHQPAYLPWLGYFDRIRSVDLFIFLDTVQFQKGSFQNRNKVLTRNGPIWLTIPVETAGKLYDTELKDLRVDQTQRWQAKHWSTLQTSYGSAQNFRQVAPLVEPFYQQPWTHMSELCWQMLQVFNRTLGIDTKMVRASEIGPVDGRKSDLVLNLCRKVGASNYLSGSQGKDYLDLNSFIESGITVEFQSYQPLPYHQLSTEFVPAMGIVDLLFNEPEPGRMIAGSGID